MQLNTLSLVNFKNYQEADIKLSSKINCFTGNNGEGKTNILDAIHYLSFCKSYFNPIDSQNILHDAPFFLIQGSFTLNGENEDVYCGLKRNQKKQFKRNKKEYTRLADHIGIFPTVMISPADSDLITEGSESRRKFMDSVIAQYDKEYLETLITYNKVLSQRNALLKYFGKNRTFDQDSLGIWDVQLIEHGNNVHAKRNAFLEGFTPIFQKYYELISGGKEKVSIQYKSQLLDADFEEVLKESLQKDLTAEYSTTGIHKDDLLLKINDYPVKKFASQGQQKSFLIALKLAQFEYIKEIKNVMPILLLDDIYDKLDDARVKQLMNLVSGNDFGQVFITDTHPSRLAVIFENAAIKCSTFSIEKGSAQLSTNKNSHKEPEISNID